MVNTMSKNTIKLITVFSLLVVLIVTGTIYAFVTSPIEKNETNNTVQTESKTVENSENDTAEADKAIVDYKTIYLEYIKENVSYFSRGLILCDLNEDEIPELFSIQYGEQGDLLQFHELKENKVTKPSENSPKTYIDISNLIANKSFYTSPENFFGIYRNKVTGEKAIINSIGAPDGEDVFDIIIYNGNEFVIKDEAVKEYSDDNGFIHWEIAEKRDLIMQKYQYENETIISHCLLRGEYGEMSDISSAVEELIEEWENSNKILTISHEIKDKDFYCYIHNVNLENNQIELIPATEITFEDYTKAMDSDRLVNINGEDFSIQFDENLYNEYGIAYLHQMPWFDYKFDVPTENYPSAVIEGYTNQTPILVKFDGDFKVDSFTKNDMSEYTQVPVLNYFEEFAQNYNGGYYKAQVENGKLTYLFAVYRQ